MSKWRPRKGQVPYYYQKNQPKRGKRLSKKQRKARKKSKRQKCLQPHPWIPYHEYLQSDWWKKRRRAKLRSAGFRCEKCGKGGPLQVHHLTYKTLWRERDRDLQVVCRGCHEGIHEVAIQADRHLRSIALEK